MRQKWEQILSKYRHTNCNLICAEHFDSNDLIIRKDRCTLKKGSVPCIFESANLQIDTICNVDPPASPDFIANEADVVNTDTDSSICQQCHILSDRLSSANNRCTEYEKMNSINEKKIRELSEKLEVLKNQLERSDLARFAINNDFIDEKVNFPNI